MVSFDPVSSERPGGRVPIEQRGGRRLDVGANQVGVPAHRLGKVVSRGWEHGGRGVGVGSHEVDIVAVGVGSVVGEGRVESRV